ncbi:MAG: lipocalin family protein [Gemmatimonadota bacterium]
MLRRSLLSFVICLVALACSDTTSPGSNRGEVGTWRLQTINGLPLPFTLEGAGANRVDVTAESMTLVAPGRVTMVTAFRVTEGGNVSTESVPDAGTYSVNGSTVTFKFDSDGSTPTATVNGDTMTLGDIGLTFVYRRE